MILDEPTAGLDPKQINEPRQLVKDLRGDHTVILSTHSLPEVSQTCTRVVIINKGKVVAVDTPDNLTSRLRGSETMYVQVDAMGADAGGALAGLPGVTKITASDAGDGVVGLEVESETGRDVRRELAAAIGARLGAAGAATDAYEPRRRVPEADHPGERCARGVGCRRRRAGGGGP